jgi:hypothetical protein
MGEFLKEANGPGDSLGALDSIKAKLLETTGSLA